MLVTESGMVTDCMDEQPSNAPPPMLDTESGTVTDCKDEQSKNAPSPMLVTESGMIKISPFDKYEISFRLSEVYRLPSNIVKCFERLINLAGQFGNGFPLIIVKDSGMVTDCKDEQPLNAPSPMLVTESGMMTDCKDEQPLNALPPMLVTESGTVTDCKDEQSQYLYIILYQLITC